VARLLAKVGTTLDGAYGASSLNWSSKELDANDGVALALLLPFCTKLTELRCRAFYDPTISPTAQMSTRPAISAGTQNVSTH
jgi:hypothetical protein